MWELTFGIGTLQTYRLSFTTSSETIEEYIHCEVLEWTETSKYDEPIFIKVKQIRNLQEYFSGKKLAGHERILKVKDLKTIDFRWN